MTQGDQTQGLERAALSQPEPVSQLVLLQKDDLNHHVNHPTAKCHPQTTYTDKCFPLTFEEFVAKKNVKFLRLVRKV